MRTLWTLLSISPFGLMGCGPHPHASMTQTVAPTALLDAPHLEGEVPPKGRSLFDQVTMMAQNDRLVQEVPYPFVQLRNLLESHLEKPMTATLIPRGRSLQRHATTAPFQFPRVILAATGEAKAAPGSLGFQLKDRIYVGYVESSQQVEVISFNPDLGRFEFQLIENYGPGLIPKVRYANREFCLACHQNHAPIFSNPSWDETSGNPRIQERLLAAMGTEQYLGIPIRQLRNGPNAIDDSTDRANLLPPIQSLWNKGCDTGSPHTARLCRQQSVSMALIFRAFGEFSPEDYETLKKSYALGWQRNFAQGLPILDNNIPNFNPLQDFTGGSRPEFLDTIGVRVKQSLAQLATDSDIPLSAEPLQPRPSPLMTWTFASEDAARLIFGLADEFTAADVEWIKGLAPGPAAMRKWMEDVPHEDGDLFQRPTFVRCDVLEAVARVTQKTLPPCDQRNFARMSPPLATGEGSQTASASGPSHSSVGRDPRLGLLQSYCGGCHSAGPLNFLAGDDPGVLQRLRSEGAIHAQRLNWEESPAGSMPPPLSSARRQLEAHPADRRAIRAFLESLATDGPS